jgi:hypothetical protein
MKPEESLKSVKKTNTEIADLKFNNLPTLRHHFSS